jgi:hypothetical protein
MNKSRKRLLSEAKKDLELAVFKALSSSPLRPVELNELLAVNESDLMRDHGCDLYMAEQVVNFAKYEQYRLRAQNLYTPVDGLDDGDKYPTKPYTRSAPINENIRASALQNISRDVRRLRGLLGATAGGPKWCTHKITEARALLRSVREYMERKQ